MALARGELQGGHFGSNVGKREIRVFPAWSDPNSSCSDPTFALYSIWIPI